MNGNGVVSTIGGYVLALAVIGAATVLAWHGTINGEATVGIFATIIAGGGAVVAHSAGVKSAPKG